MTVAQLKKQLQALPKDAVIVLAVQTTNPTDEEDNYTVEEFAANVNLRPDLKVQIGDKQIQLRKIHLLESIIYLPK